MKFALSADHLDFYQKNGFIAFDNLLNSQSIAALDDATHSLSPASFDLWRKHPTIKKILFQPALGQIATDLFQVPLVRMGFDQYIPSATTPFSDHRPLTEMSCAQPLLGALLIPLKSPEQVIYINANRATDWTTLLSHGESLLLAYAPKTVLYHKSPLHTYTHTWKELGYVFGDALLESTHPVLYRK